MPSSTTAADDREKRCPRTGYGFAVPDAAEARQAAQGAQARVRRVRRTQAHPRPATTTATRTAIAATSHGSAPDDPAASPTAAHSHRGRPAPGANAHTSATVAASISPVGVKPASAIQNSAHGPTTAARPSGAQPQHRRRHPRQAPVADQQTPVPLQQPLRDIGIPDRDRRRDELAGQTRRRAAPLPPAAQHPSPPATVRRSAAP